MGVRDRIIRRRRQWPHVAPLVDARENNKVAARDLLAGPPLGGPVLADRSYFAFARCAAPDGAGRWYISRLRAGTSRAVRLVQCRHDGTRYRRITNAPASTTERRAPWPPGTARTRPPRHAGRCRHPYVISWHRWSVSDPTVPLPPGRIGCGSEPR